MGIIKNVGSAAVEPRLLSGHLRGSKVIGQRLISGLKAGSISAGGQTALCFERLKKYKPLGSQKMECSRAKIGLSSAG